MTTSNDPDEIRAEIERTREDLSDNVNALTASVNPAHVPSRQVDKVKGAVFGVKDKVMGGSDGPSKRGAAQSAVTDAPDRLSAQTRGNPLAAGVIAFGVGLLFGSLLPTSSAEQNAATKVKDAATPVLSEAAKEVSGNLKEPAQQAVEAVKDTATEAAGTVKDEGTSAAQDLKSQAQDAKDTVAQQ